MEIYLAAPLFNPRERAWNALLAKLLTEVGEVFLPQRDGFLLRDLLDSGVSLEAAQQIVYTRDIVAIRECDVCVAILDGRVIDEGVAFEIGFATALNKICFGLKNDERQLLKSGDNPMLCRSLRKVFMREFELVEELMSIAARAGRSSVA